MKLAFCLFKYFPYGGLPRDFMRIAQEAVNRGHAVHVLAEEWEGDRPPQMDIRITGPQGFSNHRRSRNFHKNLLQFKQTLNPDATIGFNRIPDLDVYYAADVCFKDRGMQRSMFYRMLPRYRHFAGFEAAIFDPHADTKILLLAESQKVPFVRQYGTPNDRFFVLPPDIAPDRIVASYDRTARAGARASLGIGDEALLLLMLGSGFKAKGLDRALQAVAALPSDLRRRTQLFIAGQDNPKPYGKLAQRLGVAGQTKFLGGRDDVPVLLLAADLLIHPAYHENTGSVLLEAMASGLPVLATDVCGYAPHITVAGAGAVLPSPFNQESLNTELKRMLRSDERSAWGEKGISYIRSIDTSARVKQAVDVIEAQARRKTR